MSAMMTFYPQIKLVHIIAVMLSGGLFAIRAFALIAGQQWPRMAALRYLSYTIDTVLLTAAMMLLTILPSGYFSNGWLWVKLLWVVAYIGLGISAFRRSGSRITRVLLVVAALLCFLQIIGIAHMHHPAGWLRLMQA